jgi:hypothetical protein
MRSRRLQAHAGPDDRQRWQTSGIPGIPGIACSFASFTPPPAMSSMSSQYPRLPSDVCSSCLLPGRVQYRANCITLASFCHRGRSQPTRQPTICGVSFNGRPFLNPYVLVSGTAWREASQRAAFAVRPQWQATSAAISFYTASMRLLNGTLIASVGSVTICAWSFVGGLTLDLTLSALAALALQKLASRASPLNAFTPEASRQALSMAGAP